MGRAAGAWLPWPGWPPDQLYAVEALLGQTKHRMLARAEVLDAALEIVLAERKYEAGAEEEGALDEFRGEWAAIDPPLLVNSRQPIFRFDDLGVLAVPGQAAHHGSCGGQRMPADAEMDLGRAELPPDEAQGLSGTEWRTVIHHLKQPFVHHACLTAKLAPGRALRHGSPTEGGVAAAETTAEGLGEDGRATNHTVPLDFLAKGKVLGPEAAVKGQAVRVVLPKCVPSMTLGDPALVNEAIEYESRPDIVQDGASTELHIDALGDVCRGVTLEASIGVHAELDVTQTDGDGMAHNDSRTLGDPALVTEAIGHESMCRTVQNGASTVLHRTLGHRAKFHKILDATAAQCGDAEAFEEEECEAAIAGNATHGCPLETGISLTDSDKALCAGLHTPFLELVEQVKFHTESELKTLALQVDTALQAGNLNSAAEKLEQCNRLRDGLAELEAKAAALAHVTDYEQSRHGGDGSKRQ